MDRRPESADPVIEEPVRKRTRTETASNTGIDVEISYIRRLDDLFAIFDSSSNRGLTLDGECLTRYPLQEYDHLYRQIGPLVTNLTVDKLPEQKLQQLSSYFQNIRNLHLQRILIADLNLGDVFPRLVSLKLSECAIAPKTMIKIMCAVNPSLYWHFNKSTITEGLFDLPWTDGKWIPKYLKPRQRITEDRENWTNFTIYGDISHLNLPEPSFTHLILERMSCKHLSYLICGTTESLRIVDCDESVTLSSIAEDEYLKLKCLSLETVASIHHFVQNARGLALDSLEALALSHLFTPINWLQEFKSLKQLTILLPIQLYQKVALTEAVSAMENEIDVNYSLSEKPNVNLILNVLNEDCLREMFKYLTLEDIFNLAQADYRFVQLISSIDLSSLGITVRIDGFFLKRHPESQQLIAYKAVGYSLSTLLLSCLEDRFITLAPCFPHLLNLNFQPTGGKWLKTDQVIELFPSVKALEFNYTARDRCEFPNDFFTKLLRKLQPTLRVLSVGNSNKIDFGFVPHLNNLKELRIKCTFLNEDLREFWTRNQSLEALYLVESHFEIDDQPSSNIRHINQDMNWRSIASLENLTVLRFYCAYLDCDSLPTVIDVKELVINLEGCGEDNKRMCRAFLQRTGRKLELLNVYFSQMTPDEIIAVAMASGSNNMRSFVFTPEEHFNVSAKQVIQWLIKLPLFSAIEIEIRAEDYSFDFDELEQFLSASNRVLYFNGVKFPQHGRK